MRFIYKLLDIKRKKKKGFTLVEVMVVLVIMAILAAILIPTLTGYIDKSRAASVRVDARYFYEAFQTALSETYSATEINSSLKYKDPDFVGTKVGKITNYTFNKISGGITPNEAARFDYKIGTIAHDLLDGKNYKYDSVNADNRDIPTGEKIIFSVTYNSDGQIVKFEFGRNGFLVKTINGETTVSDTGKFTNYSE